MFSNYMSLDIILPVGPVKAMGALELWLLPTLKLEMAVECGRVGVDLAALRTSVFLLACQWTHTYNTHRGVFQEFFEQA